MKAKKLLSLALVAVLSVGLVACGAKKDSGKSQGDDKTIVVGATANPHAEILNKVVKPLLEKDELVIDRIGYPGEEIYLSENLNTIIGGRSTGKSTLLNSIAKKLGNSIDEGSYYFKDLDNFRVVWRDGKEDDSRKIHYIPQEYMFALARDNKKLKDLVGSIIQSKEMNSELKKYEQNAVA